MREMTDELRLTAEEAVKRLDAIDGGDTETAHADADDILLAVVPPEVREAWNRANERAQGFWYA